MSVKLDTPYFFQIDNDYHKIHRHGWRQCCLTSNAMLASTMRTKYGVPNGLATLETLARAQGDTQPENYFADLVGRYGDTIFHANQTKALGDLRIVSNYQGMSLAEIKEQLDKGIPVVTGVRYKGPGNGHINCVVGYNDADKFLWVHDPYGSRNGATDTWISNAPTAGKYDKYSYGLWARLHDGMGRKVTGFRLDDKTIKI